MTSEWNKFLHVESYKAGVARFTSQHATGLVGATLPYIQSAKFILNIGCGSGAFGIACLNFFPKGIYGQTVICSDLNSKMVEVAKATLTNNLPRDFQTKFVFQVEDGTKLEGINDDEIDYVTSIFGVFLVPDHSAVFHAIRRVLNPENGIFVMTSWTKAQCNEELKKEGFGANMQDAVVLVMEKCSSSEKGGEDDPWVAWTDCEMVKTILGEEAKFGNVVICRALHSTTFENTDAIWNLFVNSSPYLKLNEKDPAVVKDAKKKLVDLVANGREDTPVFVQSASNIIIAKDAQ